MAKKRHTTIDVSVGSFKLHAYNEKDRTHAKARLAHETILITEGFAVAHVAVEANKKTEEIRKSASARAANLRAQGLDEAADEHVEAAQAQITALVDGTNTGIGETCARYLEALPEKFWTGYAGERTFDNAVDLAFDRVIDELMSRIVTVTGDAFEIEASDGSITPWPALGEDDRRWLLRDEHISVAVVLLRALRGLSQEAREKSAAPPSAPSPKPPKHITPAGSTSGPPGEDSGPTS